MIVTAADVMSGTTTVQSIDIGEVRVGPISVGELSVSDAEVVITGGSAVLHGVSVAVSIGISIEWSVHVGMPDWIPDIDEGDTYDLGSLSFGPIGIGDVQLAALNNIQISVPDLTGQTVSSDVAPIPLSMSGLVAEAVEAHNARLPTQGFTLAGLGLGSVEVSDVSVPAMSVEQARTARLTGDTISVPKLSLGNVVLPALQMPNAASATPVDIPATLATRSIGFDAGILRISLHLTPSATSHIDALEISNAGARATVGQLVMRDVVLPYEVLNLTLSQLGVNTLTIPAVNVS